MKSKKKLSLKKMSVTQLKSIVGGNVNGYLKRNKSFKEMRIEGENVLKKTIPIKISSAE